jgi:hypothetical protein
LFWLLLSARPSKARAGTHLPHERVGT